MPIWQTMSVLALRPLVSGAAHAVGMATADQSVDGAVRFLTERLGDPSRRLPLALERSTLRAWRSLEVALAGESLWSRFGRGDDRAFRDQVRRLLEVALPRGTAGEFRQVCLIELRAARQVGALLGAAIDAQALARQAGPLARFTDPAALLQAEWQLLDELAAELRTDGRHALAQLVALRAGDAPPLLAGAVRFCFRREVEADPALCHGLTYEIITRLDAEQEAGFAALNDALGELGDRLEEQFEGLRESLTAAHADLLDVKGELQRQGRQTHLHLQELGIAILQALQPVQAERRSVCFGDSLVIGDEQERRLVRALIERYRGLPEAERHRLPALLNAVGKLELMSGDAGAAQRDFAHVAELVGDRAARAEAQHNRYLAALEQGRLDDAAAALREAAELDPARFAVFPMAKFELERVLGAGGFGVALLCRNRHSGSRVVIKALRTDGLERGVAAVFQEARLLEELDHPAVIRVRDCDYADGAGGTRPYLVMDYFDGPTLADHIRQHGPLPVRELLSLARVLAEGLHAAHRCGILHRDVKPANLLVRRDGDGAAEEPPRWRAKLIDFGLALKPELLRASLAATSGGHTASHLTSQVAGTLDYAAPEQIGRLAGEAVGPAADVYGFARTCCFALFGTPQPLRRHWASLPDVLADLLEQCLAERPSERPADFAKILDRLGGSKEDRGSKPHGSPGPAPTVKVKTPVQRDFEADVRDLLPDLIPSHERLRLEGHEGPVTCVAFSPDGRRLLSGSADHTIRLWDAATGRELRCLPGHRDQLCAVCFSPDGRRALSSGTDQSVRLWDVEAGVQVRHFDQKTNRVVAFAPDGRRAASGGLYDGKVWLWEVDTGRPIRTYQGHGDWVVSLAFTPDGRGLLSGALDRTVRIWDVEHGRAVRSFTLSGDRSAAVAFAPAGRKALSGGSDRVLRLWGLQNGEELARLMGHADTILAAAFAPDDRFAASGGHDRTVLVWDLVRGRAVQKLVGHAGPVLCVAVSPDGTRVVSCSADGTLRVWEG